MSIVNPHQSLPISAAYNPNSISYKFSEDRILAEIKDYIDSTYSQHYSQNKIQAAEFIMDAGLGTGFCLGNVIKYATRFGKKNGYNREDLMKTVHYAILALHNLDQSQS